MDRILALPAHDTFALVTDVRRHGDWIPLTRVQAPNRPLRRGDRVSAMTAGILRDRMVVDDVVTPQRLVMRKVGPLLLGSTTIAVSPVDGDHAQVRWTYDVHLAGPIPRRWTRALLSPALEAMARWVLWRISRHLARTGRAAATDGGDRRP